MTLRRHVARLMRSAFPPAGLVWLGVVASWNVCAAQVGYPADRSPYRDILVGSTVVLSGGYLSGTRGRVGVSPSQGNVYSFRFERPLGPTIGVMVSAADALTSRFVIDPTKDSTSRTTGPVNNSVALIDVGFYLMLTGGKTWRGFAPFIGVAAGAALASRPPGDTSTYIFGTRFEFAPEAGIRWYPARHLSVRADARLVFWKLTYPLQYKQPGPDGSRVLPLDATTTEWTKHPWLSLGVGWTF
jgi:hypothetical protein